MLEIRIESNVSGIFTGIFSAPIWCKFISRDFRLKRRVYRAFSGLLQFVFHGFRWTYKKFDGYAPMMAYIGTEGYLVNTELRKGSQHCQNGTPA
ncbi:MAG: hypothetical protein IIY89_08025, partial [Clostridia bacterium]|nr:hypothetical protein [Clostridia bacterium]